MIEINCMNEVIQLEVIEYITEHKWLQPGDHIKCNLYLNKYECKFTSKEVIFSYEILKNFSNKLKQLLKHEINSCYLTDQGHVVSLNFHIEYSSNSLTDMCFNYMLQFKLFYYAGSNLSFSGLTQTDRNSIETLIKEIEFLL